MKQLFLFAMLQYLEKLNIKYILNMTPSRDTDPRAGVPNFFKNDKTMTSVSLDMLVFTENVQFVRFPRCAVQIVNNIDNFQICANRYRRVSVFDSTAESLLRYFKPCVEFIDQSKHHGSILVHCLQVCMFICTSKWSLIFFFCRVLAGRLLL